MIKRFILSATIAVSLSLTACSGTSILNTFTPSDSFTKRQDVSFGDHERLKLDVYTAKDGFDSAPIIVFVHGGGWNSGSKNDYKFLADSFTQEGFNVVIPNYRLHPKTKFPGPVTDTAKAIAWVKNAYPDNPVVLIGHSAGGYNVLMSTLAPQYLKAESVDVCQTVSGVISLAGPTGIVPLKKEPYITIFPDRFTKNDAPLNNVSHPAPAYFLINGEDDKTVYPKNAQKLGEKITARGGQVEVKIYPDMDHIEPVKWLSRYFDEDATLRDDILSFIGGLPMDSENFCQ